MLYVENYFEMCILQIMRQTFVVDNIHECEHKNDIRPCESHANKTLLIFQRNRHHIIYHSHKEVIRDGTKNQTVWFFLRLIS